MIKGNHQIVELFMGDFITVQYILFLNFENTNVREFYNSYLVNETMIFGVHKSTI